MPYTIILVHEKGPLIRKPHQCQTPNYTENKLGLEYDPTQTLKGIIEQLKNAYKQRKK